MTATNGASAVVFSLDYARAPHGWAPEPGIDRVIAYLKFLWKNRKGIYDLDLAAGKLIHLNNNTRSEYDLGEENNLTTMPRSVHGSVLVQVLDDLRPLAEGTIFPNNGSLGIDWIACGFPKQCDLPIGMHFLGQYEGKKDGALAFEFAPFFYEPETIRISARIVTMPVQGPIKAQYQDEE